jgi:hydroxypyruvate isomerase
VNVSTLFRELPFLDRFAAAAEHGFSAVEFWWPAPEIHDALVDAVERAEMRVSTFTLADEASGLDLAERLACPRVYTLLGAVRERLPRLADAARERGITVLVEPVDERTDETVMLLDELGRDNVALLFDVYHVRRIEGDVIAAFERVHDRVGHVHLSDFPGRVEPGAGELDFAALQRVLARLGYAGTLGLEYVPSTPTTSESFAALDF